jgi:synaptobrevin family protein YKT6
VAFSLLNKTLDEFVIKCPKSGYDHKVNSITTGTSQPPAKGVGILPAEAFPQANDYLRRYQDPRQADSIMKVQQELDETKIVLVGRFSISQMKRSSDISSVISAQDNRLGLEARRGSR